MAGDWIKMRGNLWDDPRIARLCDITDQPEAMVIGGLYWLWATADQHTENGIMPGLTTRAIDRKTGIDGFGQALCDIGWLADHPEGVRIVKFTEHNGTSAKRRCTDAQRKANIRGMSAHDADTERTDGGRYEDGKRRTAELEKEKRREEKDSPPTPSATSAIGAVGKALKGAGIDPQTINLSDPILRSLVEQGATPEEFAGLAREAISGGKRNPIAWVLAVLPQRRSDAANVRLAAATVVKSESSEDYVKRMAEEREAERKRLEGSTGPPPDLRDKVKAMVKGMRV